MKEVGSAQLSAHRKAKVYYEWGDEPCGEALSMRIEVLVADADQGLSAEDQLDLLRMVWSAVREASSRN